MKKLFALVLIPVLAIGLLVSTGCTTVNPPTDPAAYAPLLQTATFVGLDVLVKKNTNAVPYVRLAVAALDTVIGGTNYTPAALSAAINALPVGGLNNVDVQIAIQAITQLYGNYYASYVQGQVNGNATALLFLKAVRDGAALALADLPTQRQYLAKHRR